MNRRHFLGLVAATPLAAALHRPGREIVVEAAEASVFFAPYFIDRLVPGRSLQLQRRGAATYLTLDERLMARLPDHCVAGRSGRRAFVAEATRDGDGRLRLFVVLTESRGFGV